MIVREAVESDLNGLLALYTELNINPFPEIDDNVRSIWKKMMENENHHVIVADDDGKLVSTCEVIVILNLTRGQTPFALVENVVTTGGYRGKGCGSAVLEYADKIALENGCHRIMLMTGHKDAGTVHFYESSGYNKDDKFGFVKWFDKKD